MSRKKIESSGRSGRAVDRFAEAIEALHSGEVIVFPTETLYALGADALNAAAVERLVALKGREPDKPIPILVADMKMLETVVSEVPRLARRLMDRFWPGPLTLVMAARRGLPAALINDAGRIGVRISSHSLAIRLVKELGHPITATSANPAGRPPARTQAEALAYFSGKIEIVLDGGTLEGTKGSTVVEIIDEEWRLIRDGAIPSAELGKVLA